MVKRFLLYANSLMSEANGTRTTTTGASVSDKMATGHFNRFRTELHTFNVKEPGEVLRGNFGGLALIRRMIMEAENSGSTLFEIISNSSISKTFNHEDHLLKSGTDREVQLLNSSRERTWIDANTVAMKRMFEEHQRAFDEKNGVEPTHDERRSIYHKADMKRLDFSKEVAVEDAYPEFIEPDEDEYAIATRRSRDIKVNKGQLLTKTWIHEWQRHGREYEIHPSSIVLCSGKSKLDSMDKEAAEELMRSLADDDLPLIIYGTNLINPETNGERDLRNDHDSSAISSGLSSDVIWLQACKPKSSRKRER